MSAARCSRCGINYPDDTTHCLVKECGVELWKDGAEKHDIDWPQTVERLNRRWRLGQPLPNAETQVLSKEGQLFVAQESIAEYGYLDVEADSIVLVNGVYYEVLGPIFADTKGAGWWIEEVVEDSYEALPVLSEVQYESLETARIR